MIDINLVRQDPEAVKKNLIRRQKDPQILGDVIKIDSQYRKILQEVEQLRANQNSINREIKG